MSRVSHYRVIPRICVQSSLYCSAVEPGSWCEPARPSFLNMSLVELQARKSTTTRPLRLLWKSTACLSTICIH